MRATKGKVRAGKDGETVTTVRLSGRVDVRHRAPFAGEWIVRVPGAPSGGFTAQF